MVEVKASQYYGEKLSEGSETWWTAREVSGNTMMPMDNILLLLNLRTRVLKSRWEINKILLSLCFYKLP